MNQMNLKHNKITFTTQDIYEAYRKLKSYYYYDNTSLFVRKQIAEFEWDNFSKEDKNLSNDEFKESFNKVSAPLLNVINSDNPEDGLKLYLDQINYKLTPKNIKKENPQFITNRPQLRDLNVKKCNFFIDAPIEIHLISVLWLMFVGKHLNKEISSDNYAYKLMLSDNCYTTDTGVHIEDKSKNEDDDTIVSGLQLYKPYYIGYQKWRDNAFKKATNLLDDKKDTTILSLDIKRYFYSIRLSIKETYENSKLNKNDELANKLCVFLQAINWKYTQVVESLLDDKISKDDKLNERGILPIGLLSSGFLGNFYLKEFDKQVIESLNPSYYGRYVDDILFVFSDRVVNYKTKDPVADFIEKYFVKKKLLSHKSKKSTKKGTKAKEYLFENRKNLYVQLDKVVLQDFSHKESRAAINQFKNNLEKQRSEFRFLPDEEKIESEFDSEAFLLQYSDSVNKLRSIKEFREDKFGASKFLAHKIFLSCFSDEKETLASKRKFHKSSKQILSFFKGYTTLSFYTLWEKVSTYFIINDELQCLEIFINQTKKAIESISVDKKVYSDINIEEKLKKDLLDFLKISVSIPRSMKRICSPKNTEDKDSDSFRFSNMFRHNLVGISAINYTNYGDDNRNLYSTNISEKDKIWNKEKHEEAELEKSHISQFLSPRFVHFHELNTLQIYISLLNDHPANVNSEALFKKAQKYYIQINYEWRYLYSNTVNDYSNKLYKFKEDEIYDSKKINIIDTLDTIEYKTDKKVAIANIKLFENDIELAIKGTPNMRRERRQKLFKLINLAIKEECDILVLPELAVPFAWIDFLAYQSQKNGIAIITGLEYFISPNNYAYNFVATILPIQNNKISTSLIKLRLKNHYSPDEVNNLTGYRMKIPKIDTSKTPYYDFFHWRNSYFSVYNCFELANINDRSIFKSKVDFLIATEWNKDVPYFSDVIGSWVRDLHCFFIQVNASQYGDSRIVQPTKSEERNLISVKGGQNSVVLIELLRIQELRDFQFKEHNLQKDDKRYKLTPPDFNKDNVKKRIENEIF